MSVPALPIDASRGLPRDPLRDAFVVVSALYVIGLAAGIVPYGTDHVAYWRARLPDPYATAAWPAPDAFVYSPAIAQALSPFSALLSEPVFVALWTALLLATLALVTRRWAVLVLLVPGVAFELNAGNIHILLLAVTIFGFRWPALWAFPLLTKVTPGVGLLWFAVRREWRALAIVSSVTAVIVAVSWLIDPSLWATWARLLTDTSGMSVTYPHLPIPLVLRLPVAAIIVCWGGLTDRRWTVPLGTMLALPVVWPGSLTLLVGVVVLYLADRDPATGGTPSTPRLPRWLRRTG
jgi:hypothetical protein